MLSHIADSAQLQYGDGHKAAIYTAGLKMGTEYHQLLSLAQTSKLNYYQA